MNTFFALADPTRKKIFELLAERGKLSASEIGSEFRVSPPAISQHLKVLREANLVRVEKRGQQRIYQINPEAMVALEDWAHQIASQWNERFDALELVLEAEKIKKVATERTDEMKNQAIKEATITRTFNAPREQVFKAWTDPKLLAEWFGPHMFTIPTCELDPRPGGKLYLVMRGPDGNDFPMDGVFEVVVPPERLAFTNNAYFPGSDAPLIEGYTTVTFEDLGGGKTKVTVYDEIFRAAPEAAEALAGMEEGWKQSLEKLDELLVKESQLSEGSGQ